MTSPLNSQTPNNTVTQLTNQGNNQKLTENNQLTLTMTSAWVVKASQLLTFQTCLGDQTYEILTQ